MTRFAVFILLLSALAGCVALARVEGEAHPRGPEGRRFHKYTLVFRGNGQNCILTLSSPKPDDMADRVHGSYRVNDGWDSPFGLFYDYRGHFWQGDFGSFDVVVCIVPRPSASPPWKDMESLLKGIRLKSAEDNKVASGQRTRPTLTTLNGVSCVHQYVKRGADPKADWLYIFPIDENHAIELSCKFVRNKIPGQPDKSDWRPRAEELARKILATVKVHWVKTSPEKPPKDKGRSGEYGVG
ncbi:MAG: hypothetical protein P8Z49_06715 [Acidobacteriota bacterium]